MIRISINRIYNLTGIMRLSFPLSTTSPSIEMHPLCFALISSASIPNATSSAEVAELANSHP